MLERPESCKSRKCRSKCKIRTPKCKNCTLGEVAVLRIVQKNLTATQKEIAVEIGKSERTVKTITVNLQKEGILQRVNGKRNGRWEIIDD